MLLARVGGVLSQPQPGAVGLCPGCGKAVHAKCGTINVWHWAHEAADCDPWSEPESHWHRGWKAFAPLADQEVVIERAGFKHRADCVVLGGAILELQASSISAEDIEEREEFYGRMAWLFRCHWGERIEFPYYLNRELKTYRRNWTGFWWKNGARSQLAITKPLFWDMGSEVWRVKIERRRYWDPTVIITQPDEEMPRDEHGNLKWGGMVQSPSITGVVTKRWTRDAFIRDVFGRGRMPMRRADSRNETPAAEKEIG